MQVIKQDTSTESSNSNQAENDIFDEIAEYLSLKYSIRYNALRMCPEVFNGKEFIEVNDYVLNTLFIELKKSGIKVTDPILHKVIASNLTKKVNPLKEYFDQLGEWDGKDYIAELARTIILEVEDDRTNEQQLWESMLRTFLVGMVATALSKESCQLCLVLTGGQGVGKSTWLNRLIPSELRRKFMHTGGLIPRIQDRATVDLLTEKLLINLDDQLEGLSGNEFEGLKSIISSKALNSRKPYQRNDETRVRRASIVASTNNPSFLVDTENRRYLVFSCQAIDFNDSIDRNKVMAQALALFRQGEPFWLDAKAQLELQSYNLRFRSAPVEEELILKYLRPMDSQETEWRMTTEIKTALEHYSGLKNLDSKVLGRSLRALGYRKKSTRREGGSPLKCWGISPQQGLQFN